MSEADEYVRVCPVCGAEHSLAASQCGCFVAPAVHYAFSGGMLPGTILYVYYGKVAGDVAALASGAAPARGAGHYAVLALGLAATIGVTVLVTRTARRALAEAGA